MINPLFLCGMPSSGKSIMAMLLDGHNDIFGLPTVHDGVGNILLYLKKFDMYRKTSVDVYGKKHQVSINVLKLIYALSWLFLTLDKYSYDSSFNYALYREHDKYAIAPIRYDSKIFRHSLFRNLEYFSDEYDLDLIYDAYASALRSGSSLAGQKDPVYSYSMLFIDFFRYNELKKYYSNLRMIYLYRDPKVALPIYYWTLAQEAEIPFCEIMRDHRDTGTMRRAIKNQVCAKLHMETNPDSMYLVQFNDLICDTENVMRSVAAWLEIPFSDTLLMPSVLGQANPHCVLGQVADIAIYRKIPQADMDLFLDIFNQEKELAEAEAAEYHTTSLLL